MKTLTTIASAAALAVVLAAAAAPSQAAVVFATTNTFGPSNFSFTNAGTGGTLSGTGSTFFSFENTGTALDALQFVPASFSLNATIVNDPATNAGPPTNLWTQTGVTGSFDYLFSGATGTVLGGFTLTHNEVLLHGTFNDAWIQGNGGTGSTNLSLGNGGHLSFTSALPLVIPANATSEFAYNLLNVTPVFGAAPGQALNSFTASGDGKFDFAVGVPEPATWGLMLVGFGGMGALLRNRRRTAAVAA